MPEWMAAWGEEDPEREYAEAVAKGERAYERLMNRRMRREDRYWAPIRAAEEAARVKRQQEAVDRERQDKAAYMREYRASKRAVREAVDASRKG
jgi:hypothetical protein